MFTNDKEQPTYLVVSILLIISVIFVTIGLIGFYHLKGNSLKQQTVSQQRRYVEKVAGGLEIYLVNAQQLANSVSSLVAPLRANKPEVELLLDRMLKSAPQEIIYGIGVWFEPYQFFPSERYFGHYVHRGKEMDEPPVLTYEWTTPEYNFHQQLWYQVGKSGQGKVEFTEPYFDTDLVYMSASQAFYDEKGHQFLGVVTIDMVLPLIRDYILKANLNQVGTIYLTTRQGALFVHPHEKMLLEFARGRGKKLTSILDLTVADLNEFNLQNHLLRDSFDISEKVNYVGWTVHLVTEERLLFQEVNGLRGTIGSVIATLWMGLTIILLVLSHLRKQSLQVKREKTRLEEELKVRQQAEEKLQEINAELQAKESELTQFLEAMPVGVGVGMLDDQGQPYYYYMNRKGKDLLSSEALVQDSLPSIYQVYLAGTTQFYPAANIPILRALTGESSHVDDMEIHRGEIVVPVEAWGSPIVNENHQVIYAITAFQEITERKRAEVERERFTKELFQLNQAYERFIPRELLSLLDKKSILDIQLGDQVEKEMTVLFSDIRSFTSISERMTPQDIFDFINNYLGQMVPIIFEHQGVVDKYIGDAIMAIFPTAADAAVQSAIAMLKALEKYNQLLRKTHLPPLKIGIGLNTGPVMLGTVGGRHRMEGTVIADAVNLAARVEELTKIYQTSLLITEHTYRKLSDPLQYHIRVIDVVKVKGKSQEVTVYEVYDADPPDQVIRKDVTRENLELGFVLYHSGKFADAQPFFEKVWVADEQDKVAQIYLNRCHELLGLTMPLSVRILVVDDAPTNVKLLSYFLIDSQFEVLGAYDGESALSIAELQQPHLILLDVLMPGIDGFETCRKLKKCPQTRDIPVIFLTSLTDGEDKIKGFEAGAVDYITKPFYQQEVLARIRVHLSNLYLRQRLVEKM